MGVARGIENYISATIILFDITETFFVLVLIVGAEIIPNRIIFLKNQSHY